MTGVFCSQILAGKEEALNTHVSIASSLSMGNRWANRVSFISASNWLVGLSIRKVSEFCASSSYHHKVKWYYNNEISTTNFLCKKKWEGRLEMRLKCVRLPCYIKLQYFTQFTGCSEYLTCKPWNKYTIYYLFSVLSSSGSVITSDQYSQYPSSNSHWMSFFFLQNC